MAGSEVVTGLLSSVLGGAFVAASTYLGNRKRTAAEARKLDAEADRTRAETTKLLLEVSSLRVAVVSDVDAPTGWYLYESSPRSYNIGVDHQTSHSGSRSGYLQSRPVSSGFGTITQTISPGRLRDNRVRLTGYVKANGVDDWAGLWMRVDGANGEILGFDNMQTRPIKGTTDWAQYHVVLDVPDDASAISFGLVLAGVGYTWLDDVELITVGRSTPTTTALMETEEPPDHPVNLDFEG